MLAHPAIHVFKWNLAFLGLIACLFNLTGCLDRNPVAGDQHECAFNAATDPFTGNTFDPETANRPSVKPILKIVEFTDEGEIVDRCQWSDVLFEIKGNSTPDNPTRRPKLVVIYIHGWKHDANIEDDDLNHFRETIIGLDTLETQRKNPRDVIGIYIAWPGKALDLPVLENLSFWSRKGGADRVSTAGNVSKFISSINSVSCQQGDPHDFLVGIGHSFGGRILFTSVAPLMLNEMAMKHPGARFGTYKQLNSTLDLTVLLNPAFEASRYSALDASRRYQEGIAATQQPIFISIATENDSATRYAFPAGQVLGTRWKERERTTLGNYKPYITHHLEHKDPSVNPKTSGFWYDNFCQGGLCLQKEDPIVGYPFLVVSTDSSVLDGHNGIWSKDFNTWITNFIENTADRRSEHSSYGRGCIAN